MPGLYFTNELMIPDDGLHFDFAFYGCAHLACALPHSFYESGTLLKALYKLNRKFVQDALPVPLIGINSTLI
jgi:hypothetical protein